MDSPNKQIVIVLDEQKAGFLLEWLRTLPNELLPADVHDFLAPIWAVEIDRQRRTAGERAHRTLLDT